MKKQKQPVDPMSPESIAASPTRGQARSAEATESERESYISPDSIKLNIRVAGNAPTPIISAKAEPLSNATSLAISVARRDRGEPWKVVDGDGNTLDESKTPDEQGLKNGDVILVDQEAIGGDS